MINLILAVLCSSLLTIVMRAGENKISSKAGMFISNYIVCIILARLFVGRVKLFNVQEGFGLALGLGAFVGVLFLANFLLLQVNISKNGMVLSSLFMKLGVVIPVVVAIVIFRESPQMGQITGVMLAIASIILINSRTNVIESNNTETNKSRWLLIILLLFGGVTDCMMNVYDKLGSPTLSNNYLFYIFFSALICSIIMQLVQKKVINKWDILCGMAIGVPNYFSSKFQLAALKTVPAVIVFPVYSVGSIVLISLIGIIFFNEKLDRRKLVAILIAIVALILLNI